MADPGGTWQTEKGDIIYCGKEGIPHGLRFIDSRWQRLRNFTNEVQTAAGVNGKRGMFAWEIYVWHSATTIYKCEMRMKPFL